MPIENHMASARISFMMRTCGTTCRNGGLYRGAVLRNLAATLACIGISCAPCRLLYMRQRHVMHNFFEAWYALSVRRTRCAGKWNSSVKNRNPYSQTTLERTQSTKRPIPCQRHGGITRSIVVKACMDADGKHTFFSTCACMPCVLVHRLGYVR